MKSIVQAVVAGIMLVLVAFAPGNVLAKIWNDLGLRTGFSASARSEFFQQYDLFFNYGIPLEWRNSEGWGIGTRFESSVGALHGGKKTGFIGSGGPGVSFNKSGTGASFDVGLNLNVMDRRSFGRHDFGTPVVFGAYLGASYRFDNGIRAEYRLHHTSNGHLLTPHVSNPGLDLHMFGISWGF